MSYRKSILQLTHNTKNGFPVFSHFLLKIQKCAQSSTAVQHKSLEEMPGLSSLPLIGSVHHFLPIIGSIGPTFNFSEMQGILHEKYGSIVKMEVFARSTMVILFEPGDMEQVMRSEDIIPSRPGFETFIYYRTKLRKETFDGVYGLTTAEGAQWREFRTKVNPALLMPQLVKLYTPVIDDVAKDAVERFKKIKDNKGVLQNNFYHELSKWSLESIALVGLGSRLGCLDDDLLENHPGLQLMNCAKNIIELSFKLEFMPSLWKYIPTSNFKKLMNTYDTQWRISELYIEQAKKRIEDRGHDIPEEEKSIIEKLLAIDPKVALMMANEMLLAGIDTVAFATMGLLYQLSINPEKQQKLRDEIRSNQPRQQYLKACIKESLRIWPAVPANLRRTTKDHIVGGYLIPKGIDAIFPNEYLSKNEKYYPKPYEFLPERWIVGKTDPLHYGKAHPMITLPFGFGVRSCIGRRIAELEIERFITRMLDQFEVGWEGPPMKVVTKVMNAFVKPYRFTLKDAK